MRIVSRKVSPKEPIVVYAVDYLRNLTQLVNEYNSTTQGKM